MGTDDAKVYQAPEWLTADFLQDVFREYYKDENLEVCELVVKSVLNEGCASELHRATFNLMRNDVPGKFSVIIKDHPKGYTGVVTHKCKLFRREILSYKEILPRIEELLATIDENSIKISPACYYTTESPEPFLILEDMEVNGFVNFEKCRLFTLEYVLLTIRKLAKLHACSAVLAAKQPHIMDFFQEGPISRNPDRKDFLGFYPVNIRCVAEEIAHWKGYEVVAEKMFKLAADVLPKAVEMYESHSQNFCVFNLADLWINNLMFRLNEVHEPEDVILLDYQLAYYGSPAVDLNYLLFGSLNENVRKVHFKYLIREYHCILKETLEKLHYKDPIPTLKDITIELIKNSLQGVIAATCLTPLIFMEAKGFENLKNLNCRTEEGDKMRRDNVENPKYRTFLQRTVKEFELCGFLDE